MLLGLAPRVPKIEDGEVHSQVLPQVLPDLESPRTPRRPRAWAFFISDFAAKGQSARRVADRRNTAILDDAMLY